jgi:hypothetical protein
MTVVMSIASMSWRALGRIEHRRLAAPHDMTRPAHGGRRIDQHDLADHHPVERAYRHHPWRKRRLRVNAVPLGRACEDFARPEFS